MAVLRPVNFIPKFEIKKFDKSKSEYIVQFKSNVEYSGCLLPTRVIVAIPYGSDDVVEILEEEVLVTKYGRSL